MALQRNPSEPSCIDTPSLQHAPQKSFALLHGAPPLGSMLGLIATSMSLQALPRGAPIDLATVCFAGGTSPDRLAARDALEELAAWAPARRVEAVD